MVILKKLENGRLRITKEGCSIDINTPAFYVETRKDILSVYNNVEAAKDIAARAVFIEFKIEDVDWENCEPSVSVPSDYYNAIDTLSENFFVPTSNGGEGSGTTNVTTTATTIIVNGGVLPLANNLTNKAGLLSPEEKAVLLHNMTGMYPTYVNKTAAIAGGLISGMLFRTLDGLLDAVG